MSYAVVDNQKIAINTLLLYARMLVLMGVQLYTSRVLLNTLGIEDYGIYNVVGGVVALFGFINSAMTTSSQRYITYEIGRGNVENLKNVFATSFTIHILIASFVVILGETVGLWFVIEKIVLPPDRTSAALWVYQFSLFSTAVAFLCCPFNADIISHEKMSAFAYISIMDSLLKLIVVFLLTFSSFDKLVTYSCLILVVQCLTFICYFTYCRIKLVESRNYLSKDRNLFKEMTGFAAWNLFGNLAAVLMSQGVNIVLNLFFGPTINAARAVAVQVQAALHQFSGNFQMAVNPQITKSYAADEHSAMHNLIYRSTKLTFFLLLLFCLPVFIEAPVMLKIWLKIVPEYSIIFLRIMIATMLIESCANPLMISVAATGNVRKYQMTIGGILLLILPVSYFVLKFGCEPWAVFAVQFFISIIAFNTRLFIVKPLIGLNINDYFNNAVVKCIRVLICAIILPVILKLILPSCIISSATVVLTSMISVCLSCLYVGLNSHEREFVISKLKRQRT